MWRIWKLVSLKGPPVIGLVSSGFDFVSVANDDISAYRIEGVGDTVTALHENGILCVRLGRIICEATGSRLLEVKGVRFAFFACSWAYEATFSSAERSNSIEDSEEKGEKVTYIVRGFSSNN